MSKNIEARLAKVEERLEQLDGRLSQDQWLTEWAGGLEAFILEEEPEPAQKKVFNDWLVSQGKRKVF